MSLLPAKSQHFDQFLHLDSKVLLFGLCFFFLNIRNLILLRAAPQEVVTSDILAVGLYSQRGFVSATGTEVRYAKAWRTVSRVLR